MKLKIYVKTPRGRSEWVMKMMKSGSYVGSLAALVRNPLEEKVLSESEFYYVVNCKPDEYKKYASKAGMIESGTRMIYLRMIKMIDGANKVMNKSVNGIKTAKNWVLLQLKKVGNHCEAQKVRNMDDNKFKLYLIIEDREDIEAFLKEKELVRFEILDEKEDGPEKAGQVA